MNLTLRRILILVLIVLGLIAGTEIVIRTALFFSKHKAESNNVKNNADKPSTDTKVKVYPSLTATDFYKIGSDFLGLIEDKKFDEAYNLLDEGYKAEYFPTLESYKQYCMKNYISESGKDFSILSFDKASANTYTAEGLILDFEGSQDLPALNEYMTLRLIDEKNYRLSFKKYVLTKSREDTTQAAGVRISIKKAKLFWDKTVLTAEIENLKSNPIAIAQQNQLDIWLGILDNKNKSIERGLDLTDEEFAKADFIIKPGEKAVFNFPFYTKLSEKPTGLYFSNIKSGPDVVKTQILFKELW